MGEVSGRIADFTIITSDNPRRENPTEIIAPTIIVTAVAFLTSIIIAKIFGYFWVPQKEVNSD